MNVLVWLIPAFPLAGSALLATLGRRMRRWGAAAIGAGSVGLAMLSAAAVAALYLRVHFPQGFDTGALWSWMSLPGFQVGIGLYLDSLSLLWTLVITGVGFLIHLYSVQFMAGREGYHRFFTYMNLFVGAMLLLVLADSLLLLCRGWVGVGLCSYLLIGFWYKEPANNRAAVKAFVVTRVGDTAFLVGILLLFTRLGGTGVQELMSLAPSRWGAGNPLAVAAAALLLGGAVGKSAQLPLQTWLPDAMAGPTPVSALIHAATMVTSGVYLIARMHVLFSLAPAVQLAVAFVGGITLVLAGFSAAVQRDIKRVIAYSTISQIGYMFLGLGVGGWPAAAFHFLTHACFKSLLFLGAGVLIKHMAEEHSIFRMGGLWRRFPLTFWTFLLGGMSMAAIPPVFAGFFSKDWILYWSYNSSGPGLALWLLGLAGVVLTATYTFRMIFIAFLGPPSPDRAPIEGRPGAVMVVPLIVLSAAAAGIGYLQTPHNLGDITVFSRFIRTAVPAVFPRVDTSLVEGLLEGASVAASALGVLIAFAVFRLRVRAIRAAAVPAAEARGRAGITAEIPARAYLRRYWFGGWGFDWLYDRVFARPYRWIARGLRGDLVSWIYRAVEAVADASHFSLSTIQNGRVRRYAGAVVFGVVLILIFVVLL
jgi:NADH-quinone oxidoreductase subunit L